MTDVLLEINTFILIYVFLTNIIVMENTIAFNYYFNRTYLPIQVKMNNILLKLIKYNYIEQNKIILIFVRFVFSIIPEIITKLFLYMHT